MGVRSLVRMTYMQKKSNRSSSGGSRDGETLLNSIRRSMSFKACENGGSPDGRAIVLNPLQMQKESKSTVSGIDDSVSPTNNISDKKFSIRALYSGSSSPTVDNSTGNWSNSDSPAHVENKNKKRRSIFGTKETNPLKKKIVGAKKVTFKAFKNMKSSLPTRRGLVLRVFNVL